MRPTASNTHLNSSAWRARTVKKDGLPLYAKASNPPLAIFHGTDDTVVPFKRETGYIVGGYNSPVPVRCATKFAQFAWA